MATLVTQTREALIARRKAVLERLGLTRDEASQLAATRSLSGEEVDALDELDEIDFLLGEH